MTKKKIIKFETKKEGKVNMLSRAISVKADKKKNKLISWSCNIIFLSNTSFIFVAPIKLLIIQYMQ